MLSKSSQLTALRYNNYRLKRMERKISVLNKNLFLTRRRLYSHMPMAKAKKRVSENVLSICLAESENTTLKLQEELKDQTIPHLSAHGGICHLNVF